MSAEDQSTAIDRTEILDSAHLDSFLAKTLPVSFAGCVGWLHTASGNVGVLLCPGVGEESRAGYRPLLVLADRLARAGYPTLRFQYPGTGDSSDPVCEDILAAWQRSVHAAVQQLRFMAGVQKVVLCGLRLGATLAAIEAAHRDDVEAAIFLAPIVSGKSYIRELKLRDQLRSKSKVIHEKDWLESDDFKLSPSAMQNMKEIDLRKLSTYPQQVLILSTNASAENDRLAQILRTNTKLLTSQPFQKYSQMMRIADDAEIPAEDINNVVLWLQAAVPSQQRARSMNVSISDFGLRAVDWVETPLRFGNQARFFGMLCEPVDGRKGAKSVVVIGNTGADPHFGVGRFYVTLARELARHGVSSLRFDFAGFGDSDSLPNDAPSLVYDTERTEDFSSAIDELITRGYSLFTVAGLCSGAYHAFHTALREPRITGLVMINLALFEWVPGTLLSERLNATPKRARTYIVQVIQGNTWVRLLQGRINFKRIFYNFAAIIFSSVQIRINYYAKKYNKVAKTGFAYRSLLELQNRKVNTLFMISSDDNVTSLVDKNFGKNGYHLSLMPNLTVKVLDDCDHILSRHSMRVHASKVIANFARENAASSR